ncbi:hypothetical protein I5K84_17610, partial [Pseudomonas aeruginosa]|nr:hypothetical protein [Pseudomonas aeruginosa]
PGLPAPPPRVWAPPPAAPPPSPPAPGAPRAGPLQRIVGDTAKAPLVALLEQREKRWQAQPKRHFRLPFERWPQALGEMRRHLAERLPALHDLGLEGLDAPRVAALPGDQLFTLTTLSLWQQEYGASL